MHTSWILDEVSSQTRPYHAKADLVHLRLFASAVDGASYRKTLMHLHGFQTQLVSMLANAPMLAIACPEQQRQLAALESDLIALGADARELRDRPVPEGAADPAHALGWFYVAERMSLWTTLVTRRLRARLAPEIV